MNLKRKWPLELDQISRYIGEKSDLVQGPGGNVSWKDGEDIWVKASGAQLRDAESKPIFCRIRKTDPYKSLDDNQLRPSIESLLHASIPATFVIHLHSIGAVSLAIRENLESKARSIITEFNLGIIPYLRPGKELAKGIESNLDANKALNGFLLQNHGIVAWGEDLTIIFDSLLKFESKVATVFPIKRENLNECEEFGINKYLGGKYITPDHAVFSDQLNHPLFAGNPNWIRDLCKALCKSVSLVGDKTLLKFLPFEEALTLQNWEAEKFRKRQNI